MEENFPVYHSTARESIRRKNLNILQEIENVVEQRHQITHAISAVAFIVSCMAFVKTVATVAPFMKTKHFSLTQCQIQNITGWPDFCAESHIANAHFLKEETPNDCHHAHCYCTTIFASVGDNQGKAVLYHDELHLAGMCDQNKLCSERGSERSTFSSYKLSLLNRETAIVCTKTQCERALELIHHVMLDSPLCHFDGIDRAIVEKKISSFDVIFWTVLPTAGLVTSFYFGYNSNKR